MARYDPDASTERSSTWTRWTGRSRPTGALAEERREIAGLQPERAEVILAGACIVRTILTLRARTPLTVSDRGFRHGVVAERFG